MPFEKGQSGNLMGRPKGSTNKISAAGKDTLSHYLTEGGGIQALIGDIERLRSEGEIKDSAELTIKLLPFIMSKQQQIDVQTEVVEGSTLVLVPHHRLSDISDAKIVE